MTVAFYAVMAALANVVGGLLVTTGRRRSPTVLSTLVAFGGGFMLAVAVLEMLPIALEVAYGVTALLLGYLAVHLTQHVLTPHFHLGEETHVEAMASRGVGVFALLGLLPHAFFDGVAIFSGHVERPELGLLIFLAVALHKVPTGLSLASIMLASGNSARQAILAVVAIGAATLLGAAITPVVGVLARYGLALAAGVTLYVAASNLIPEVQQQRGWQIPGGVFLGVLTFYLARLVIPGH